MTHEELFVGAVAVLLGVGGLIAAIGNADACYRLQKVRWIESIGGRSAARLTYAVLGVALILLGVAIALGFAPNKHNRSSKPRPSDSDTRDRPESRALARSLPAPRSRPLTT